MKPFINRHLFSSSESTWTEHSLPTDKYNKIIFILAKSFAARHCTYNVNWRQRKSNIFAFNYDCIIIINLPELVMVLQSPVCKSHQEFQLKQENPLYKKQTTIIEQSCFAHRKYWNMNCSKMEDSKWTYRSPTFILIMYTIVIIAWFR